MQKPTYRHLRADAVSRRKRQNILHASNTKIFSPFKLCMGKESKQMYQEDFGEAFDLFNQASTEGQTLFQEWKPLNTSMPADMAAIQKALGVGGAAKVFNFFAIVAHSLRVILQLPMRETSDI